MTRHFPRRYLLHLMTAAALPAGTMLAWASDYPRRPVRLIVPFAPGGTTDIAARMIGLWLADHLHQAFVIENRPGANGAIATELVVRANPDGYTLIMVNGGMTINSSLYKKLPFNLVRDIAPVACILGLPQVMAATPSFPAKTVPELIAYAKANPGKINLASGPNGSPSHVSGELFKMMAGVDMLHVPYGGDGPALLALLAGEAQVMFPPLPASLAYIQAGTLRALAVSTGSRVQALPDTPALAEFVPGYEVTTWQGLGAPKNTPAAIIETLNHGINAALADPAIKQRLVALSAVPLMMTPAAFGKLIVDETDKWAMVIKFAGIQPQ
jgi:tripartite-type tricarboxylate transporter receptor subunit TctC